MFKELWNIAVLLAFSRTQNLAEFNRNNKVSFIVISFHVVT
jgi:hypothetical protein